MSETKAVPKRCFNNDYLKKNLQVYREIPWLFLTTVNTFDQSQPEAYISTQSNVGLKKNLFYPTRTQEKEIHVRVCFEERVASLMLQ